MEITTLLEYNTRQQLREWLDQNAATERCCWVATYRGKLPPQDKCLRYVEVVEEALCFGWIDSTVKRLPDGRLAQRLSPRRKGSHWTELNLQRCADLERRGLMTEAGRISPSTPSANSASTSIPERHHKEESYLKTNTIGHK